VLLSHLQTFLARADERAGPGLPRFVRRELYAYLDCGILAGLVALVGLDHELDRTSGARATSP
jgi:hypothetical protein